MWDWIKKHWVEVIVVLVVIYVLYYAYENYSSSTAANSAVQVDQGSAIPDYLTDGGGGGVSSQGQASTAADNPIQGTSGPSPVTPSTGAPTNTSTAAPGAADAFVNGQFQLTGPGGPSQADALAANASQVAACSSPGASWPSCENTPMVAAIFTQNGIPVPSVGPTNVVSTTAAQSDPTATTPSPVLASRPPLKPILAVRT